MGGEMLAAESLCWCGFTVRFYPYAARGTSIVRFTKGCTFESSAEVPQLLLYGEISV